MIGESGNFFSGLWEALLGHPILQLIAMVIPFIVVARFLRITPTVYLAMIFASLSPVPVIAIVFATSTSLFAVSMVLIVISLGVMIFGLSQFLARVIPIKRFQVSFPPLHARMWLAVAAAGLISLIVLLVLATVGDSLPMVGWTLLGLNLLILVMGVIDMLALPKADQFSVERETARIASLLKKQRVTLTLTYKGARGLHLSIRDDVPQEFLAVPEQFELDIEPRSRSTVHYELEPLQRGSFSLGTVYLQIVSPMRLWKKIVKLPESSTVSVYPDMKQLSEYALLARTNRLSLVGVRRTRKVGQDHDFERLRDYTRDDNYKHIDWRSTARRRKLTVREFQTSQSQRIIFMIDCGRMMTNEADGISLLDHAFNAMLMLGFVALRQGDSVGAILFSDRVHKFVPPKAGASQMNRLLHACYDQFPELVESRYDEAFMHLRMNCRKRSLVVLITNVIDEVNSHQIEQYLTTLVGRHLPIGVLLRDHRLFDAADNDARYGPELFQAAAAAEILTWRHQVLTDLSHKGVLAMDLFAEDLTANLVNQYLEIKARHLL